VPDSATSARRTDLSLRGRLERVPGVVAEDYPGLSSHDVNDTREAYGYEGGTRDQHGARLSLRRNRLWALGSFGLHTDDEVPSRRLGASGGYDGARLGTYGTLSQTSWDGVDVFGFGMGGWLGPVAGVTLFGSWDGGRYAGPSGPPLDELPAPIIPQAPPTAPPGPAPLLSERSLLRGGASASLFGITVAGAALRLETDVHWPLQLELDRGAGSVLGGTRYGGEGWASVPVPVMEGLRLEGSYQQWGAEGPYLPRRSYQAAFVFHRTYLETGNFELWWRLGVRGYDPMQVFSTAGGLEPVPFYQNWYGRITARILTVSLYFTWENLAVRRNLQSYPGRLLPPTRSFFGLHWDLWN
jgi:hypothetical protein